MRRGTVLAIMSDLGWETPFFQRIQNLNKIETEETDSKWMSWKKLVENQDEQVAKLMVRQQKILTRPHKLLDHDDEGTKAPSDELRLQYKYAVESEISKIENTEGFHKHSDGMPDEDEKRRGSRA